MSLFEQILRSAQLPSARALLNALPPIDPVLQKHGLRYNIYRKLLYDPFVFGCVETRRCALESFITQLDRNAPSRSIKVAEAVLNHINLTHFASQCFDAVLFGFSVLEITWQQQSSLILPVKVEAKPQEFFSFSNSGDFQIILDNQPISAEQFPYKFILVQHRPSFLNPYGDALLSRTFWPVTLKRAAQRFWALFIEKYGIPFLLIHHPPNLQDQEVEEIVQKAASTVQDAIVAVPEGSRIEIIESQKTSSSQIFADFKQECDAEIAITILGHTGAARSTPGRLGSEHAALEVKQDRTYADARIVQNALNTLLRFTAELNNTQPVRASLVPPKEIDTIALSERDARLSQMIQFTASYFQKTYKLDPEDFTIAGEPQQFAAEPPDILHTEAETITINGEFLARDLAAKLESAYWDAYNSDPAQ